MKDRPLFLLVLTVFMGLLLGLSFYVRAHLEWGERRIYQGYSGEARYNDFAAAQRILRRTGREADTLAVLPEAGEFPSSRDLILIPRRHLRLSPGQVEALLHWVDEGGTLVLTGAWEEKREDADSQDPLLEALGARVVPGLPEPAPSAEETPEERKERLAREGLADVEVKGRRYTADLGWSRELEARGDRSRAESEVKDRRGRLKVLEFAHGHGVVVLFASLECFANWNIAEHQHADLLWALGDLAKGKAWFVDREERPSLGAWLRRHAWMVLAAATLLIALTLWRALPRFGPRLPDPPEARRSLLEHLAACGRFQWRQREGEPLLQATREGLFRVLRRTHPAWAALPPDELSRQLAGFAGLPEERVFKALRYDRLAEPREFTDAIHTLDLLRKKL